MSHLRARNPFVAEMFQIGTNVLSRCWGTSTKQTNSQSIEYTQANAFSQLFFPFVFVVSHFKSTHLSSSLHKDQIYRHVQLGRPTAYYLEKFCQVLLKSFQGSIPFSRVPREPHYLKCPIYGADIGQEFFKKGQIWSILWDSSEIYFATVIFKFHREHGTLTKKLAVQNFVRLIIFIFHSENGAFLLSQ